MSTPGSITTLEPMRAPEWIQEPAIDWGEKTIDQMLSAVQRERDQVDFAVFEELAGRDTVEAFEALQRCSALIGTETIRVMQDRGVPAVGDFIAGLRAEG